MGRSLKALVIDEPWISLILKGEKTWEMRRTANHDRGLIGLVRKGSGAVVGIAQLIDSKPAISPEDYPATERFHAIRGKTQSWAIEAGYLIPWVLAEARPLPRPVPYQHKPGSQSRIILTEEVAQMVRQQLGDAPVEVQLETHLNAPEASSSRPRRSSSATRTQIKGQVDGNVARLPLSQGNIKHGHFYLRSILDFFSKEAIGGSDASQKAHRLLTVQYRPGSTVRTDIAGPNRVSLEKRSSHFFFRERASIRDFFARTGAQGGDTIIICRDAPDSYIITLEKMREA